MAQSCVRHGTFLALKFTISVCPRAPQGPLAVLTKGITESSLHPPPPFFCPTLHPWHVKVVLRGDETEEKRELKKLQQSEVNKKIADRPYQP